MRIPLLYSMEPGAAGHIGGECKDEVFGALHNLW